MYFGAQNCYEMGRNFQLLPLAEAMLTNLRMQEQT
jgi:hypothetical protein